MSSDEKPSLELLDLWTLRLLPDEPSLHGQPQVLTSSEGMTGPSKPTPNTCETKVRLEAKKGLENPLDS